VGGVVAKWGRRVNTVQKHVRIYVNVKMILVETIPEMQGGGIKERGRRGEFKYDIL
jgi:hypothetical protein